MTPTPKRNNEAAKSLKLSEIAALIGGELSGDGCEVITGVSGLKEAKKGDISFLANDKYLPFLRLTKASAVIALPGVKQDGLNIVHSSNPSASFTKVVTHFHPEPEEPQTSGIHPAALVASDVVLGEGVSMGPYAVIEAGCVIGPRTRVGAHVFIGRGSVIGDDCRIYPNATLRERVMLGNRVIIHSNAVIGGDGFGYETESGKHIKIPQLGSVELGDDVEVGAGTCIDRGRFRNTRVGRGTKIDNLVQIAHNVTIGEDCLIISQVGISGSSEIGDRVVVAGQAGLVGHISIGNDAVVGARSGVSKSVPPETIVLGEPAKPIFEQKRLFAAISRLPELLKEFAELKKKLS